MYSALYVLDKDAFEMIYGVTEREAISQLVNVHAQLLDAKDVGANLAALSQADILLSGWGCPVFDKSLLDAAPNLKAVFYGAGSIKTAVTDEFWQRGIRITSAYAANAIPVAEFTLSQIIYCLKSGWRFVRTVRNDRNYETRYCSPVQGTYGSTVGIISLGMVGRRVCQLLKHLDVDMIAYDPYASQDVASDLGVTLCSLDDVFRRAHVVSLHTPDLPSTQSMIRGEHFEMMQPNASFINTARGAVVREDEMIRVLKERPDIQAVLDVTFPEPPSRDSLLFDLPNVALTPHIAGSMGGECRRMGKYMVDELKRFIKGERLLWEITEQMAGTLA